MDIRIQARKQNITRAVEVSWNEGTFIYNTPKTTLLGNILEFHLLDALKVAFQTRNLTHRWTQSGYFFLKWRYFFLFSKKIGASPYLPTPLPLICLPGILKSCLPVLAPQTWFIKLYEIVWLKLSQMLVYFLIYR